MIKSIAVLTFICCSFAFLPFSAEAEQASRCHCFRDRDYDPARKFAADEYLLTSSFNSLIAATLGVSKREIVMMKMRGGVDPDELLVALYIADKTESRLDLLLSIHKNGGSWQDILHSPGLEEKSDSDPVLSQIKNGMEEKGIATLVADTITAGHYHASEAEIFNLHTDNFSSREINLIFALHNEKKVPLKEIAALYRQNKMSWSEIADSMKLSPSGVGKSIKNEES